MQRHLRVARGAGGEEHEHRILAAGRVRSASVHARKADVLLVKAAPPLAVAVDDHLDHGGAAWILLDKLRLRQLRLVRNVAVGRTDKRLHVRRPEAVDKVVVLQLAHSRYHHSPDLVEREYRRPILVVALQYEHHLVAAPDSDGTEVVRHLVRHLADLAEREAPFSEVVAHVQHGELVGIFRGNRVHHVIGEVEALDVLEADMLQMSGLVLLALDEPVHDERHLLVARAHRLKAEVAVAVLARHHHREKRNPGGVGCRHAVRRGRTVVDGIAFVKLLDVLSDADLHRAFQHDVELLSCVGGSLYGLLEQFWIVLVRDPVGRAKAVTEHGSLVADVHVRLVRGQRTLPSPRHLVTRKMGAVPLQERVYVDAEGYGALVEKIERRVEAAGLDRLVVGDRDLRLLGHLLHGIAYYLAHLADTRGHLAQISIAVFAHRCDSQVFVILYHNPHQSPALSLFLSSVAMVSPERSRLRSGITNDSNQADATHSVKPIPPTRKTCGRSNGSGAYLRAKHTT